MRLVDLTDVTLAFEDANSKLFEVVTVADIDAEKHVDGSWCRFGLGYIKFNIGRDSEAGFGQDFEVEV